MEIYYSSYLEGILNMASSLSNNIGPSYIKVDCYKKKSFRKEFCKFYEIEDQDLKYIESNKTLDSALLDWLQDKKIVESIMYWFNIKLQGEKKVFLPNENIINILDTKQKDFYSLDDLFFVECRQYIFVFLLGNNE